MKTPIISTIGINGIGIFNHHGTPGAFTICIQYALLPEKLVIINVKRASTPVTPIFPVILAPPGKNGISPKRLFSKMKKKIVKRKGRYFSYLFSPIDAFAISSLTKRIIGSTNDCKPLGAFPFRFLYELATEINTNIIKNILMNIANTFFVMEISSTGRISFPSLSRRTILPALKLSCEMKYP